jgi:hypothetical protein
MLSLDSVVSFRSSSRLQFGEMVAFSSKHTIAEAITALGKGRDLSAETIRTLLEANRDASKRGVGRGNHGSRPGASQAHDLLRHRAR